MKTILLLLSLLFGGSLLAQPVMISYDASCSGVCDGEAQVIGSGHYKYLWDNGDTTDAVKNLCAGKHWCILFDSTGSIYDTFTTNIRETGLNVVPTLTNVNGFGIQTSLISLVVKNGVAPVSYKWSNGATASYITSTAPGDYSCTITDSKGCSTIVSVPVTDLSSSSKW